MKANTFLPALLLAAIFNLFSCKHDTAPLPPAPGKYAHGVFVVNEGPFGGTGSISWYNPSTGETVSDVFALENKGAVLGQFVQSLYFHNDKAYIVVNGANKIYVVDAETFKYQTTIEGLTLPRFFLPLDEQTALVSQWGNGATGSIARIDLGTHTILSTTPVGGGPEKMVRLPDGRIYVANSGGLGADSTVSVLDALGNAELSRILTGGKNPGSIALLGVTGQPYAHCRGTFTDATPKGWVGPLDGSAGFDTAPFGDDLVASPDGNLLYFSAGGSIWKIENSSAPVKLFDQAAYGLGVDPQTGNLFCADAGLFSANGEIVVYSPDGQRLMSFPAGIAPSELIFR